MLSESLPRRSSAVALLLPACALMACGAATVAPRPSNPPPAVWGFIAPWDQRSDSSLRANSARLDVAITGWIQLDSVTGRPSALYPDDPTLIAGPTTRLALVSSFHGQRFHPEAIRALATDTAALTRAAGRLAELTVRGSYRGIVLDLEGQSAADTALKRLVSKVYHGSRELLVTRLLADKDIPADELRRIKKTLQRRLDDADK